MDRDFAAGIHATLRANQLHRRVELSFCLSMKRDSYPFNRLRYRRIHLHIQPQPPAMPFTRSGISGRPTASQAEMRLSKR